MQRSSIAYILTPIEFGGAERVSLNFLKNVDRDRFDIRIVALIRPWEKANYFIDEIEKAGLPVFRVPVALFPRTEGTDYLRILRCYRIILGLLRSNSFDLVHTHGYFADIVAIPSARLLFIPTISTCHGYISNDRTLKVYNTIDRFVLKLSKRLIAVSDGIRENLVRNGVADSRIKVITNAVNTDIDATWREATRRSKRAELNLNEADFLIGYIGRLSREKGLPYLIEAAAGLNPEISYRVLLLGTGPEQDALERQAKELGVSEKFIFAGFRSDVEKWLPAMDLFVLPSLTEGTPMSALEAMAASVPVLATSVGGVPKVIDSGSNGLLVPPAEPGELKCGIVKLYKDADLRERLAQEALKTVRERYCLKDWVGRIEAEYSGLIKK